MCRWLLMKYIARFHPDTHLFALPQEYYTQSSIF